MVLVAEPKRTTQIHHKKRSGQHHKHSQHYIKPYLPYLPLIAIVGIGVLVNSTWTSHVHSVLGASTDITSTQLLADTNTQRNNGKESPLQLNTLLTEAAQGKADDMVTRNYWSHNTPDGRTPWSFINAAGYQFAAAGENLAYGFESSDSIMNGWMNSAEHRVNVLDDVFTQVGFGIAKSPNFQGHGPETIVVAEYAEPASIVTTASENGGVTTLPAAVVSTPQAAKVSRIQSIYSKESWLIFAVTFVTAAAILWFVIRHGLAFHRVVVKSEEFIIHHPMLDVGIVAVATLGVLLTRTAGFIH
jgi:uncharacterized protein YkwD